MSENYIELKTAVDTNPMKIERLSSTLYRVYVNGKVVMFGDEDCITLPDIHKIVQMIGLINNQTWTVERQ